MIKETRSTLPREVHHQTGKFLYIFICIFTARRYYFTIRQGVSISEFVSEVEFVKQSLHKSPLPCTNFVLSHPTPLRFTLRPNSTSD